MRLEILFINIKSEAKVKGISTFNYRYLYAVYVVMSPFSKKQIVYFLPYRNIRIIFYIKLKPNLKKFEISDLEALKGVKVGVRGM